MKKRLLALPLFAMAAACSSAAPPEPVGPLTVIPPFPDPPAKSAPEPAPAPVELSPEEKKKAEEAKKLAEEFAQLDADTKKEAERWTDAIRAQAKELATKDWPTARAALEAALKSAHRMPGAADRDGARHPIETLEFFGLQPTSKVLEWSPGAGWYTELLAPVVVKKGKLIVTSADPNGPRDKRLTLYGQRLRRLLDRSKDLFGAVEVKIIDPKKPDLGIEGQVDLALAIRTMHDWHRDGLLDVYLAQTFKALAPGGIFGVVQHRAKPDANPDESAKKGYLPEPWLIQRIEAAGFKLLKKSEVNANPKDTKDYEEGVWALPPTLRNGDKDRDKYVAIGESDRMTLRFQKPAPGAAKKPKK